MSLLRLIARLDIKGPNVVKGLQMEGLRVVGKPESLALKYVQAGAHELLYIDTVATLYGRNQLTDLLERTTREVFIPITVGGGIKSRADVKRLLDAGADSVAINSAAIRTPLLVKELSESYGSQAITVSIEAKRTGSGWEAFTDNGREKSGKDAVAWAHEAVELGAGEILITSVDRDGTNKGFDLELIEQLSNLPVPVVASGGMGSLEHLRQAANAGASGIAVGHMLHYNKTNFQEMSEALGIPCLV